MIYRVVSVLACALLLATTSGQTIARDSRSSFPIADVLEMPEAKRDLAGVKFYFGEQSHPAVERDHGEFRTNKKTNAFNKSDKQACEWAMLTALAQLHDRALSLGADAVINIKSNYKNVESSSETEYECGAGNVVAGVALKGTVVKLKRK